MQEANSQELQIVAREAGLALEKVPASAGELLAMAKKRGLSPADLRRMTARIFNMAFVEDLLAAPASAAFVKRIPIGFARRHGVLGLATTNGHMPVAIADLPLGKAQCLDVLARFLGEPVTPVLVDPAQLGAAINLAYQQQTGQAQQLIENMDQGEIAQELAQFAQHDDLLDSAGRAPVIKLVNILLFEAVKQGASDIHVHPHESNVTARFRIDGVLFDAFSLGKGYQEEIISRIKVMGRMNIAEKRLPQDGRATVQVGDRIIDLRIASLPTSYGERIVVRLLDKSARLYELSDLGLDPHTLGLFRQLIGLEHGLILVTGPTGAGKTTTLYAALQELDVKELNVLTLEDPIEYQLPGISQTQVSEKKGMSFASGLRSVLRQDPDVIMVGEIRDHETAVMAIQSALTGHLVFSTLHTNDAASAVTRLMDLGIEAYLVASSLVGVLAQRLVRRVCRACSGPAIPDPGELGRLGIEPAADLSILRKGSGCAGCRQTGYSGRVGIFELLVVDGAVRRKIMERGTAADIRAAGIAGGMQTLREGGLKCMMRGITTGEEVLRVTTRAAQDE